MVRVGLATTAPGIAAPSTTYRPLSVAVGSAPLLPSKTCPFVSTTPSRLVGAIGQPPRGCVMVSLRVPSPLHVGNGTYRPPIASARDFWRSSIFLKIGLSAI